MPTNPQLSPKAEIWGGSVAGMLRGLEGIGAVPEDVNRLWQATGLPEVSSDCWYSVRTYLAFLERVAQVFGSDAMQSMGRAIPGSSKFPPQVESLAEALSTLDVAYQVNHRGGVIGRYHCADVGPGRALMICENPYPCDLDRGILESLVARFQATGVRGSVTHLDGRGCRKAGAWACPFEVRWWDAES